ncbi:transcriptional regulator [Gordonia insulae]|uniref:transcriptional regulator n=1 Tax=Gordonia insulae TaxID=2420509 RepID=UPI000F5BB3F3|nr:transcriptional regulator [Gordonia insulae]
MTVEGFDELIHPSTRLTLVATLAAADWAEFAFLKDRLALSDSALSKQISTLEDAGYLVTERRSNGRRRTVRARLTEVGRSAFAGHIAALQSIVSAAAPLEESIRTGRGASTHHDLEVSDTP